MANHSKNSKLKKKYISSQMRIIRGTRKVENDQNFKQAKVLKKKKS